MIKGVGYFIVKKGSWLFYFFFHNYKGSWLLKININNIKLYYRCNNISNNGLLMWKVTNKTPTQGQKTFEHPNLQDRYNKRFTLYKINKFVTNI